jgi:hypothetical protein
LTRRLQIIISEYLQTNYLKIQEFSRINDIGIDVELKPAESLAVDQGDVPHPVNPPVDVPPPIIPPTEELADVPPSIPAEVLPAIVPLITSTLVNYAIVGKTHLQKLEIHAEDIQTGGIIEYVVHNLNLFIAKQWEEYTIAVNNHESIATNPGISLVQTSTNYQNTEFDASFGPPEFQITDRDTVIVLIKIKELRIFKDSTRR